MLTTSVLLLLSAITCEAFVSFHPSHPHHYWHSRIQASPNENDDIYVMVNGMPGPMATAAAEACLRKGLKLSPVAMTGPDVESATITVVDPMTERYANVRLIPSNDQEEILSSLAGVREAVGANCLLAIDYTHPSAVNNNGRFYVQNNIPFVMGTTGGDRDELLRDVQGHFCVVAPNMGKQIVAMQAALADLGNKYPGAFAGYTLQVVESHQTTKADTSGTAKAVIDSIQVLTADTKYSYDDIEMLRDEAASLQFGVPPHAMNGHAFHTYTLTSPDQSVQFQLQHNVAGRTIYAEGTADAVKFLARQLRTASSSPKEGRVYNMIDVLAEGALE
jgi:4-hydroxy-tetrahydrodipicolinate reductase